MITEVAVRKEIALLDRHAEQLKAELASITAHLGAVENRLTGLIGNLALLRQAVARSAL